MSIFRLSTEFLRKQQRPGGSLATSNLPHVTTPDPVAPDLNDSSMQNALNVLTRYIPTEIVTLYIPALAMLVTNTPIKPLMLYCLFGSLTPIVLMIVYQGQRKANGYPLASWKKLPWWRMGASMVAFLVWALSVPGTPIPWGGEVRGSTIIAGFLAILVSVILSLLEPWMER
jgi:hypothetical protein